MQTVAVCKLLFTRFQICTDLEFASLYVAQVRDIVLRKYETLFLTFTWPSCLSSERKFCPYRAEKIRSIRMSIW